MMMKSEQSSERQLANLASRERQTGESFWQCQCCERGVWSDKQPGPPCTVCGYDQTVEPWQHRKQMGPSFWRWSFFLAYALRQGR